MTEEQTELVRRTFLHFKGNLYRLEGFAKDSETLEEMVVYRALYGEHGLWVRSASCDRFAAQSLRSFGQPDAVLRRRDTNKWYALVARLSADKVGGSRKDIIEAVNLRRTDSMDGLRFLPAYHMNKKTWTTIVLDGTVGAEELQKLLTESRELATR